jgi:hypothetical protein
MMDNDVDVTENNDGCVIEIYDRYSALGIPRPDPTTMCKGQCEGTGFVPVKFEHENDDEGNWHDLWLEAEKLNPCEEGDDWHFVKCPRCKGTRLEPIEDQE